MLYIFLIDLFIDLNAHAHAHVFSFSRHVIL